MSKELSANTTISHYRIVSKLGVGGMGEVYLAEDLELERQVALKVLLTQVANDEGRVRRFVQEAKAASALNHPNIITIYEIDRADSVHFIATEFIDGETLRNRMRQATLRLGEVLDIAAQIASALSAAHNAGIVHRDIKPDNVMLRRDGIVKVLDFGLAKLTEQLPSVDSEAPTLAAVNTETGVVMGTALYMSPEQARGLKVDARTDIFSLGVLIYELAAGRLPFDGSNSNEIIASILSDKEPPPLARYSREVPAELERIVSKALRKNRDERYQTSKDLLLDLRSLKQSLEFESELQRSAASLGERETNVFSVPPSTAGSTTTGATTHPTSSVEYLVSEIKQHKRSALIGLAGLLVGLGLLYWFLVHHATNASTTGAIDSIAVMPFENMSHDQNSEYLSDGVTESLINSLSQLPHIKVIARSSVFQYKNQKPDLQQVASRLNVRALLTGRVIEQADTLSVNVELTDAQNNTQLWGQHYTRKAADIFAVQDEIARQVTDALRVHLTGGQQEQVTKRYTENPEAYRLYLQGRYYLNETSEQSYKRAISLFDQAIALDSRYALAYTSRAETFFGMSDINLPMNEAKLKIKQDLTSALSIDDKLVEARAVLASLKFQFDWDFRGADEEFKQVIALNPNYAEAHHQYGYLLTLTGKPMEGLNEMKLAQQLDPVNPIINLDVCLPYFCARQFNDASAASRKTVEMFPDFFLGHMVLGQALCEQGDYSKGIDELLKAKALEANPLTMGTLGYSYAKSGRKDEARKLLADLTEQSKRRYIGAFWIALIHVGLDEKDEAFTWLERAYQDHSYWLVWIKMDPRLDSLRSDPRFTDLMRRVGFPQ